MLRPALAPGPGHSRNLPRGGRCSVTLATILPPSFSVPRSPGLRRNLPLDPSCDPIILPTEHKSRWEIDTPILEMTSAPPGKRHLPNLLPSILFRTTARKIPISTTSSADHQILRLPSQSSTALPTSAKPHHLLAEEIIHASRFRRFI